MAPATSRVTLLFNPAASTYADIYTQTPGERWMRPPRRSNHQTQVSSMRAPAAQLILAFAAFARDGPIRSSSA